MADERFHTPENDPNMRAANGVADRLFRRTSLAASHDQGEFAMCLMFAFELGLVPLPPEED